MPEKRVRVAIIGAGWAGHTHARFYKHVPFVDVVGWADVVPGKAAAAAAEWGVPLDGVFEDYREMFAKLEIDGVSVCTFNMGHKQPTLDALAAGKHVLLEKPMAATLEDARAIMRGWEQHKDCILMVGFQPDFSAEHQAARQIVDAGALGDVYYAEAVAHRRFNIPGGNFVKKATAGAGTLVDFGVYGIHTALWLMNDPTPVSVTGIAGNPLAKQYKGVRHAFGGTWTAAEVEVEEYAFAMVRFANGAAMTVKSTWAAHADTIGRTFFLGTKGGLALDPLELYVNQQYGDLNMTAVPKNLRLQNDWESSWVAKMRAFAEAVRDGKPSPIDPRGAFLVNVVMDGILRSAKAGHEVKVDADYVGGS
ncbi:MAG TPA: Gfo/Idh/MocA family oxidoreductase [Chloroflexota bacterium]|nr:Gfo/Idh/MocA family oxidoreductase [Chloroflexota bacterium]